MHPPSAKIVGLKHKVAGPHLGAQNDAYFEQKRENEQRPSGKN